MKTLDTLIEERNRISNRINEIRNTKPTRLSATGVMILQAHEIIEWEKLDEELGKLNVEIHKLKNVNNNDEEVIQLIPYNHYYVIPTYSKGGILTKGGLLESYFKGRLIQEHDSYVKTRHNKSSYKITNVTSEIIPNTENNYTSGSINIKCSINGIEYSGNCKYNSRINENTFFYFNIFNINVVDPNKNNRGISKTGKTLLKYICAMEYRKKYKTENCNINLD